MFKSRHSLNTRPITLHMSKYDQFRPNNFAKNLCNFPISIFFYFECAIHFYWKSFWRSTWSIGLHRHVLWRGKNSNDSWPLFLAMRHMLHQTWSSNCNLILLELSTHFALKPARRAAVRLLTPGFVHAVHCLLLVWKLCTRERIEPVGRDSRTSHTAWFRLSRGFDRCAIRANSPAAERTRVDGGVRARKCFQASALGAWQWVKLLQQRILLGGTQTDASGCLRFLFAKMFGDFSRRLCIKISAFAFPRLCALLPLLTIARVRRPVWIHSARSKRFPL